MRFGGLFNPPAASTANATPATASVLGSGYIANTGDSTVNANLNDLNAYLNPTHTSNYGTQGYSGMDAYAPAAVPTSTYHSSPVSQTPTTAYAPSGAGGIGALSPTDLTSMSGAPAATAQPTYVSELNPAWVAWHNLGTTPAPSPFTNPGVQGLSPDDRRRQRRLLRPRRRPHRWRKRP